MEEAAIQVVAPSIQDTAVTPTLSVQQQFVTASPIPALGQSLTSEPSAGSVHLGQTVSSESSGASVHLGQTTSSEPSGGLVLIGQSTSSEQTGGTLHLGKRSHEDMDT